MGFIERRNGKYRARYCDLKTPPAEVRVRLVEGRLVAVRLPLRARSGWTLRAW